jgi:hypothetical protein
LAGNHIPGRYTFFCVSAIVTQNEREKLMDRIMLDMKRLTQYVKTWKIFSLLPQVYGHEPLTNWLLPYASWFISRFWNPSCRLVKSCELCGENSPRQFQRL